MKTQAKATRATLIKRYHTLASKNNMSEQDRFSFLSAWGATSSTQLTDEQLDNACRLLARKQFDNPDDLWRKRVIAAIGEYLTLTNRANHSADGIKYIKAIACKASSSDDFNRIPADKLRSVYNSFCHYNKVIKDTGKLINKDLEFLISNN